MMKHQIFSLVIKEFLAVWRDKRTRSVLILPPLIQLLVFSFAATLEVKNVVLGIYTQDQGYHSHEIIERLSGSPEIKSTLLISNEADLKKALDDQDALMVVHFPADFSRKIERREQGTFQLLLDGRRSNAASIVSGYVNEIIKTYNQEIALKQGVRLASSVITVRHWFNPNLEYTWYTVPCLVAILSLVIALVLTSLSIAREREMGTFEQLLVSPITPKQILLGKTIPALFLSLAESTVIVICAIFIFKISFEGSFFLLYASMFIFLLSVVGIGLFISSLCATQQQAVLGTFVFMVPATLLSGFSTPIENMPMWLQYATELVPLKHFLIVVKGLFLKDMSAQVVFDNTWPNAIIAVCTLTTAHWFFRRRLS